MNSIWFASNWYIYTRSQDKMTWVGNCGKEVIDILRRVNCIPIEERHFIHIVTISTHSYG